MKTTFQIRRAEVNDAAEVSRLSNELGYPASITEMAARLTTLLPQPEQFVAVAVNAASLVGWISAERRLLLESGERAEIVGLVVGSSMRRAGVGKALVEAAEQWALAQHLTTISVRSNIVRVESHPFYQGIGYVKRKTQHSYTKLLSAS